MIGLSSYLVLAALMFSIGLFGVLTRRNAVGILLGIELMLNAVNINLVAFARFHGDLLGLVFTLFTLSITVAEVAVGLAIRTSRSRSSSSRYPSPRSCCWPSSGRCAGPVARPGWCRSRRSRSRSPPR